MLTGCQEKKTSTTKNSSSVTATESKSSDKSSSSEKNSSKPEIEEISAENFQKMLKNKDYEGAIVFFKTPSSKEADDGLKKFAKKCQKIGRKLYVVDMTTETGKKVVEKYNRIAKPYDAVIIKSGAPLYLDIKNDPNLPAEVIKGFADEDAENYKK
ncbi:hypothetical protein XA3_15870 [Xylocopilactobacillus apicola]|uniref:Lipoprotein n=2 Tax=Xylocopilactobacillus apicola TaxID=2932184 RepID=A0AAU9DKS2_9LACO|nr:hypothetical protein XA3_15870 [Xylocopilactobacillus apicola]